MEIQGTNPRQTGMSVLLFESIEVPSNHFILVVAVKPATLGTHEVAWSTLKRLRIRRLLHRTFLTSQAESRREIRFARLVICFIGEITLALKYVMSYQQQSL